MCPFMHVAVLYPSCVLPCFTWRVWSSELLFLPFHPWFSGRVSPFMRVAVLYPSCVLACMILDITYA
jgi:hypothetical protein